MRSSFIALSCALALTAQVARAEEEAAPITVPITVLATGSETAIDQTGQAIGVLTAEDLQRLQGPDLVRVVEHLPGVAFARTGGPGSQTSLFVRGANSEHVLVLVDGVRLNDVSSPKGANDFATLQTGGLGSVELLRGSNSVIWGSEAIGGVLAVTSRELNGVEANAEGGTHASFSGNAVAGISNARGALTLNGGYDRTDGVSAARSGTEAEGYEQWRVGGTGRFEVVPGLSVVATARYARSHSDMDGYAPPLYTFGDTLEYQITRQFTARGGLRYRSTLLDLDAGYAFSDTRRDTYDGGAGDILEYGYAGRSQRAELTGRLRLPEHFALDFGADSERQTLPREGSASPRSRLNSVHALLGWYGDRAELAAGLRYDDHNQYGDAWTFGANASVRLAANLRLRASYGEGFRAPTLFELYDPTYGNVAYQSLGIDPLRPERSRSYDAGLEWGSRDRVFAAISVFRRDTRNLIEFFSCYGVSTPACDAANIAGFGFGGIYYNASRARAEGVELEWSAKPSANLAVGMNATFLRARDRSKGTFTYDKDLPRRPFATVTGSIDWKTPLTGLSLGADLRFRSESFNDRANATKLEGGMITDLRASYAILPSLELYGRVENLFDAYVPTVADYNTWGRAAFAGVRVRY
ncbi:TonB-dependent receptor plug domain-containing protein [Novosphingobium olei]|uniref:TonB-dependent receptor n=1 Tax=Novosphingobium olei TaxID=2728851 RepID=A0A7Y0G9K3_9SPHN|nr:TonB-dependent receptor [Novosphingobium olei]NML93143.1 TonB-dependent receptor [Novosphingobium olei]